MPDGLHADGRHRRERRAQVRRLARRPGRLRAALAPARDRGAEGRPASTPRSSPSRRGSSTPTATSQERHRRTRTSTRAPTPRSRSWPRSSPRSIRRARSPPATGRRSPTARRAVVVASGERAKQLGVKPLGWFRAFAVAGVPPEIMGIGPVPAVRKLLKQDRPQDRGHRPLRAQRSVRRAGALLRARARRRPREAQRQRRRHRARPSARRLGHAADAHAAARARAAAGGRYGVVTMCIGGGMGAAAHRRARLTPPRFQLVSRTRAVCCDAGRLCWYAPGVV